MGLKENRAEGDQQTSRTLESLTPPFPKGPVCPCGQSAALGGCAPKNLPEWTRVCRGQRGRYLAFLVLSESLCLDASHSRKDHQVRHLAVLTMSLTLTMPEVRARLASSHSQSW